MTNGQYLRGLRDAREAVLSADAYADAIGAFNGRPIVTAETVRHLEAIDNLIKPVESNPRISCDMTADCPATVHWEGCWRGAIAKRESVDSGKENARG